MDLGLVHAATPTPLRPDGSLDTVSAKRLCRRWLELKLDGVLLLGSMGEGPWLPDSVRNAFVELALAEVGDELTLFASAADVSPARMRERARRYAQMGIHCVVLCLPPGLAPASAIREIKAIADSCPVPCAYYDIPALTGTPLVVSEIQDLLSHPNIVACKDSSGNALLAQALTSDPWRPADVTLLDGTEYRVVASAQLGYDGLLHGGGVLTGAWVRQIWDHVQSGRLAEALDADRQKSFCLAAIYNRFHRPLQNTIGQKYALKLLGVLDHETVLIDQALNDADRARIEDAVATHRDRLLP